MPDFKKNKKTNKLYKPPIFSQITENLRFSAIMHILDESLKARYQELDKKNELGRMVLDDVKAFTQQILTSPMSLIQKTFELVNAAAFLDTIKGLDQKDLLVKLSQDCLVPALHRENTPLEKTLTLAIERFLKPLSIDNKSEKTHSLAIERFFKKPLANDNKEEKPVSLPRAKL
ncbi:MAG: hypothetical protein WAW86_07170 [Gammaproteobacteria bacterium]